MFNLTLDHAITFHLNCRKFCDRRKNPVEPKVVVKNWMRNRTTIEFFGLWEKLNNPDFKGVEFAPLWIEAGSNAGLQAPAGSTLTIGVTGSLTACGGAGNGAGTAIVTAFGGNNTCRGGGAGIGSGGTGQYGTVGAAGDAANPIIIEGTVITSGTPTVGQVLATGGTGGSECSYKPPANLQIFISNRRSHKNW